jgi:hypothetical protein
MNNEQIKLNHSVAITEDVMDEDTQCYFYISAKLVEGIVRYAMVYSDIFSIEHLIDVVLDITKVRIEE